MGTSTGSAHPFALPQLVLGFARQRADQQADTGRKLFWKPTKAKFIFVFELVERIEHKEDRAPFAFASTAKPLRQDRHRLGEVIGHRIGDGNPITDLVEQAKDDAPRRAALRCPSDVMDKAMLRGIFAQLRQPCG